ncbi:MAG: carboxypeptidase-like regulatory domain-containing protein [Bacteroidota bacterium]
MQLRSSFLLFFLLLSGLGQAQVSLNGQVLGADNKQPIASANVYLSNSSIGTITNEKGQFIIHNFPSGRYDLVVSCIGYVTQVITVSSAQLPPSLKVLLKPNVQELQEVIVEPYEKNGWEKWGSFFIENFIGTSAFAADCKLLNKDVVKFRFSKKNNILKVIANDRLVIENKALGYLLKYDLTLFEYNFTTRIFIYQGYPLFEEMDTKRKGLQRRWKENREDAYFGSIMHFMRSLYRNKLIEQNFEVRKLIKLSDTEKKRVRNLYRAQVVNAAIEGTAIKINNGIAEPGEMRRDSAAYYRKVMNEPESLNILINKVLPGDSIAFALDSVTVGLEFTDYLQVVYTKKQTPPEYKKMLPKGVESMPLTSDIFRTRDNVIMVLASGNYFEGIDLITSGYWAWSEKIAAMLPNDYWPEPKKQTGTYFPVKPSR